MTETVTLVGGPFDGQTREVHRARQILTLDWEDEYEERDQDGCTLYVTRVELASYRRSGPHEFVHCRVPSAIGDTDLDLPAETTSSSADSDAGRPDTPEPPR